MIYIINDIITFNSDDCTLSHIPTQESLSLSISSGRLFEQLLNSGGEILARDTLLTEVWDKYGLRGSNSNLNQYLSIVRRALAAFGCENLIITIPKIGIRLNTEIKVERESPPSLVRAEETQDEMLAEVAVAGPENQVLSPAPEWAGRVVKKTFPAFRVTFILIVLALMASAAWYYAARDTDINTGMSTVKLEGGCEAVFIQGLDVFEKKSLSKQILQMLAENNESCVPGRRIYFDKNTAFSTTNYGRTLISACNLNGSGHIISCENFYYLDWRIN